MLMNFRSSFDVAFDFMKCYWFTVKCPNGCSIVYLLAWILISLLRRGYQTIPVHIHIYVYEGTFNQIFLRVNSWYLPNSPSFTISISKLPLHLSLQPGLRETWPSSLTTGNSLTTLHLSPAHAALLYTWCLKSGLNWLSTPPKFW